MKILFLNTYYHPFNIGGAEISVQLLAEELVHQGNEVVVICLGEKTEVNLINGVKIYYLGIKNVYLPASYDANILQKAVWHTLDSYNPLYKKQLTHIIRDENPDLVHTHNISGFSVSIWELIKNTFNLPIVHTIRDYYLLCPRGRMYENKKRCVTQCSLCAGFSIPKKKESSKVDYVTGISTYVLNKHLEKGYFSRAFGNKVISNPVDINALSPEASGKNVGQSGTILGFLGRVEPAKGIEYLLNEISAIPSVQLLVGGEGEEDYVANLKRKYDLDNIEFMGFVNPSEFFEKIHYLVVPSHWEEPFGRVVIEAYAAGVPVVGSKRGGVRDLIEEDITGWLFEPEEESELKNIVENIENIGPRLYHDLMVNCLEKAKKYESARIANSYVNLYSQIF